MQRSKFASADEKSRGFCWDIYIFLVSASAKNVKATEFLGILKKYFSMNKKYTFLL